MIVTKGQMIGDLFAKLTGVPRVAELTRKDLELVINTYFSMIGDQLIARNGLRLGHIGTLKIATRKGRTIKLPGTDREIVIPDKEKVVISPSKLFLQALKVS